MFADAFTGDGRTYRIDPLLATLSTLPIRVLLEVGIVESFRLPIVLVVALVPPEYEPSFLSLGILSLGT
jgi:hypothetical protein